MVGAKKLNEMRVNPRRGVVNNISVVKTEGFCGLAGYLVYQETRSLTLSNLINGQTATGI
jgi:hypothetical protein